MPRVVDVLRRHKVAIVFTTIGVILSPFVAAMLNEYITITPRMLSGLLEDEKVSAIDRILNRTEGDKSKANVLEFNDIRKQFKQSFRFEGLDLSNKVLTGVNLDSVVFLNSNLSGANLQKSKLDNVQISGDLSGRNLDNASLLNADLSGSDLSDANLRDVLFANADVTDSIFMC
jgi:uncharacterized protein YjbI with pentapeptide repeats